MDYIRITDDNIEKEHICCAMSGKQGVIKKEWLKQRFKEGLVFCRSTERGKCFIEYIPAENAWVPIQADGYFYIDCLWVSGSLKGHGYSNDLLEECIWDAKKQGRKGLCILSSEGRKREFLSDPKYLAYKGFAVADTSECGINLMYLHLHRMQRRRDSRPVPSTLRWKREALSSIIPTSARLLTTGCRVWKKPRERTVFL